MRGKREIFNADSPASLREALRAGDAEAQRGEKKKEGEIEV